MRRKAEQREGASAPSLIQRIFKPHDPTNGDLLLRCSCGKLMWKSGSERKRRVHLGHEMRPAQHASFLEWLQMKLGLIR